MWKRIKAWWKRFVAPTPPTPTPYTPTTKVVQKGLASWYDEGAVTANGETFNPDGLTAAHRTLPFNTIVIVTNATNSKSVAVRINDRGPFVDGRIIDLSRGAFQRIAPLSQGVVSVSVDRL